MPHIHEKIDFTVEVFIVHGNKVLLRKHDKLGILMSVGGHIELHEDPTQAAVREVQEEVGLTIELAGQIPVYPSDPDYTELLAPRFLNRHRISENHEHVTLVYFARSTSTEILQGKTEQSDDIRWFSREEITDPGLGLRPHVQLYALAALDALSS